MTKTTFNRICIERLQHIAPDQYKECQRMITPRLAGYQAIPSIINFVESQGYEKNSINGAIFIGTVYALLVPYKLYYQNLRTPTGLRDIIAKEMGFVNDEMVNYHANILPTYTHGNGRWLKKIESLADGYLNTISQADEKL